MLAFAFVMPFVMPLMMPWVMPLVLAMAVVEVAFGTVAGAGLTGLTGLMLAMSGNSVAYRTRAASGSVPEPCR